MPSVGPGAGASLWTPLADGDSLRLFEWWDATDVTTIEGTTASVTAWRGRSKNGYRLTPPSGRNPTTGRALAGKNALNFDAGQTLRNTSLVVPQPTTLFVAASFDSFYSGTTYVTNGAPTARGANLLFSGTSPASYRMFAGVELTGGNISLGPHVLCGVFNGASSAIYLDGELLATGDAGTNSANYFWIGSDSALQYWIDAAISQVVAYSQPLDVQQVRRISAHLGAYIGMPFSPSLVFT